MPRSKDWFGILESVRSLSRTRDPFTAEDLAREAGIRSTGNATINQIASAWLGKFCSWGYVERVSSGYGKSVPPPPTTYTLTNEGRSCTKWEKNSSKLARLVAAVRAYQATRGGRGADAAFAMLIKVLDDVEKVR